MMKKRVLFIGMVVLLALSLAFLTGCPTEPEEEEENLPFTSLEDSVWLGEPAAGEWATLNFKAAGQVAFLLASVGSFNGSGTPPAGEWAAYTYDGDAKTGAVTRVDAALGAAPGSFTISRDTKVLTFTNYRGSGSSLDFKRVRPDAENTFTLGALPENLAGTVWGGTNPMQDSGWITLAFTKDDNAGAFTHDNTSRIRTFSYDNAANPKAGSIGSGIGAFTINAAGDTLTLANMFNHGTPIVLKRFR